jgi:hypothetical protein
MNITPVQGVIATPAANYGNPWNGPLSSNSPWYTGIASNATVEAARAPLVEGVAVQLGLDPVDLSNQLHDGASIAEVASSKGIDGTKVIEAIQTMMVPNVNLNGDFVQRIAMHKTAPMHHKHREQRHVAAPEPVILGARPAASAHTAQRDPVTHSTEPVHLTPASRTATTQAQPAPAQPPTHLPGAHDSSRLNTYM